MGGRTRRAAGLHLPALLGGGQGVVFRARREGGADHRRLPRRPRVGPTRCWWRSAPAPRRSIPHRADGVVQCLAGGGAAAGRCRAGVRNRANRPNRSLPLPVCCRRCARGCMAASTKCRGRFCCVYHNRGCLGPWQLGADNNKERSMFDSSSHVPPRRPGRRDHQRRRPALSGCTTTTTSSATPAEQRKSLSSAADETFGQALPGVAAVRGVGGARQGRADIPGRAERQLHHRRRARQGRAARGRRQCRLLTTAGSIGFQAGAQSKAMVLLFMTQGALDKFRNSSGWTSRRDCRGGGYRREWPHRHQHGAAAGGGLRDEQWRADGRCVAGRHEDIQDRRIRLDRRHGAGTVPAGRLCRPLSISKYGGVAALAHGLRARDLGGFDFRIQAAPAQDAAARFLGPHPSRP